MQASPSPVPVDLGNITGLVEIDLTRGSSFVGTLIGNVQFAVKNGLCRPLFQVYLTMGGAGGYTATFDGAGGLTSVNPFPLVSFNGATTPGVRTVVWHTCDGSNIYNLGSNSSP